MFDSFSKLIRGLRVGVVVQSPSTEILLCNPAALELLGLDESQLAGKTSYDADWNIIREDGTAFEAESRPMARVLATGGAVRNVVMGVYRPRTKDRTWLLVNAEPEVDDAGKIVQIVATLIDISDRKRLESSLLEARKLESIGRLAGGIAHDFNNLLTVIMGATSLAVDKLPAGSPVRAELEVSLDAIQRAAALTRQLLMFARKSPVSTDVADVKALVDAMRSLLTHVVGSHIALQIECASTWSTRITSVGIEQVLVNLVANARDAMPSGGCVRIRTDDVTLAEERGPIPRGRYVRILVEDNGSGIPAALLERLFEPFFTTKEPGRGTGLGLATVQSIVTQHGGWIDVASEVGKGTTFHIFLRAEGSAPVAAPSPATVPRGGETILVADDELLLRGLAKSILEELGYTVLTAADGEDALKVAAAHPGTIDLLLTDLTMPRMNGYDLATRLRASRPLTRVLLSSGYADGSRFALDDWALLDKPYTPQKLAARVREVLDEVRET